MDVRIVVVVFVVVAVVVVAVAAVVAAAAICDIKYEHECNRQDKYQQLTNNINSQFQIIETILDEFRSTFVDDSSV